MKLKKGILPFLFTLLFFVFIQEPQGAKPIEPKKGEVKYSEYAIIQMLIQSNPNILNEEIYVNENPKVENFGINNAIKRANANELADFFNNSVEVLLPNNNGTYSKAQAQIIFVSFFGKNPVKSFVVNQEGSSSNSSNFTIGTYLTSNNVSYRVYYVTKKNGNKELIHHIEFEEK